MKHAAFILFTIVLLSPCLLVLSQNSETCNRVINFNDIVNFDTTAMFCNTVWKSSRDYILRYKQAEPQLWSFLLSATYTNSWLGIGFSTNGLMDGSSAMVGWIYLNGTGVVEQYFLQGKDPDQVLPNAGNLTVVDKLNSSVYSIKPHIPGFSDQYSTASKRAALRCGARLPIDRDGLRLTEHRDKGSAPLDYITG